MEKKSDRKLLELAAKAIGINLEWDGHPDEWQPVYYEGKTYHYFNPIEDDGQAFRFMAECPYLDTEWFVAEAWQAADTKEERLAYLRRRIVEAVVSVHLCGTKDE